MAGKSVTFLNPSTCGIYKSGGTRYRTDPTTGQRTTEIDNELMEAVEAYLEGRMSPGEAHVPVKTVFERAVLVPTYYDERHNAPFDDLLKHPKLSAVTVGQLLDKGVITVRGGHGSPGNDQRTGYIPYIKVSDIRALRINVNPTNLVSENVATRLWKGESSGLQAWDLVTPNRASSNIGEFAILLPGEEKVVMTKEVFVFRIAKEGVWDPFYLLWAFCLRAAREQWRRIALMQTNREDCGNRYREIVLPRPPDKDWAREKSAAFRSLFRTIADAKRKFVESVVSDEFEYIASVRPRGLST